MSKNIKRGVVQAMCGDSMKAVLFDLDGVLINSPEAHYQSWKKAFEEFDVEILPEDLFVLEGLTREEIAKRICEQSEIPTLDAPKIAKKKDEYYHAHHKVTLYPGSEALIDSLKKKGYKLGIVTASTHGQLTALISPEFFKKFDVILYGSKVAADNPYTKAAAEIGIPAEHCIVVENAPIGVHAAKRAGMYCIAVTTTLTQEHLSQADKVVSLQDLPKVIL
jgi:beta-phosphoglucomutase